MVPTVMPRMALGESLGEGGGVREFEGCGEGEGEGVEVDSGVDFEFGVARTKIRASPASVEREVSSTVVSEAAVGTVRVSKVVAGANGSKGSVCCSREKDDSEGVAVDGTAMMLTSTTCISARDDDGEGKARIYITDAVAALAALALVVCEVSNRQA